MKNRIRELRVARGLTLKELARLSDTSWQQISKLERGERTLRPAWQQRLAKALGVSPDQLLQFDDGPINLTRLRVVGFVQAGAWREGAEMPPEDQYWVDLPHGGKLNGSRRFGLEVRGPSMNEIYPEGSILICVPLADLERQPQSGDRVIIRRSSDNGLVETTCKEYRELPDGSRWLWPRSSDPNFQSPIRLPDAGAGKDSQDEVVIEAKVVASYRPE